MSPKKTKFNLGWTFLIATIGSSVPLIRNLIEVNGDFTKVDSHHYILLIVAAGSFYLAYQIVKRMNIHEKTESFYLSIIGVYFLIFMSVSLLITMGIAVL